MPSEWLPIERKPDRDHNAVQDRTIIDEASGEAYHDHRRTAPCDYQSWNGIHNHVRKGEADSNRSEDSGNSFRHREDSKQTQRDAENADHGIDAEGAGNSRAIRQAANRDANKEGTTGATISALECNESNPSQKILASTLH